MRNIINPALERMKHPTMGLGEGLVRCVLSVGSSGYLVSDYLIVASGYSRVSGMGACVCVYKGPDSVLG
jgi:hypothetical protein